MRHPGDFPNRSASDARLSCVYAAAVCIPVGPALGIIGISAKFLFPDLKSVYALPVFPQNMNVHAAGFVATSLVAHTWLRKAITHMSIRLD
jgi:SSS family solute:Na+ symporter